MSEERRRRAPKPDWGRGKISNRISTRDKEVITDIYEKEIQKGTERENILASLASKYDKSIRQIERYISEVRGIKDERKRDEAKIFAREVIEEVSKQSTQPNPFITKALEKHLNKLRNRIEAWRTHIKVPPEIDLFPFEDTGICLSEEDWGWLSRQFSGEISQIDECLQQHLPYDDLWQNIIDVTDIFLEYMSSCEKLIQEFRNTVTHWPVKLEKDFERPMLHYLSLGYIEETTLHSILAQIIWNITGSSVFATIAEHSIPANPKWFILEADNPSIYIDKYKSLTEQFIQSESFAHIKGLYRRMFSLIVSISDSIDDILARQDYLVHKCRLCPGRTRELS
jgi:hypothetical protein